MKKEKLKIPQWFNLNNYEKLADLSWQNLLDELTFRVEFYSNLQEKGTLDASGNAIYVFPNRSEWQNIISGNPLISMNVPKPEDCKCIDGYNGIAPITNHELEQYFLAIKNQKKGGNYTLDTDTNEDDDFIKNLCDDCNSKMEQSFENYLSDEMIAKLEMLDVRYGLNKKDGCGQEGIVEVDDNDSLFHFYLNHHFLTDHDNMIQFTDFFKFDSLCAPCELMARKSGHLTEYASLPSSCKVCDEYSVNIHESDLSPGDLLLRLDIANNTNEKLIKSFELIVNEARKRFEIPNPPKKNYNKLLSFMKGIIELQVIPYLDLRLWKIYKYALNTPLLINSKNEPVAFSFDCDVNDKKIPQYPIKKVSNTLFGISQPDTYTGGTYFTKSVIPRYHDMGNLKSAQSFLNEDGLGNQICSL